jgi:hypothetical protein
VSFGASQSVISKSHIYPLTPLREVTASVRSEEDLSEVTAEVTASVRSEENLSEVTAEVTDLRSYGRSYVRSLSHRRPMFSGWNT